VTEQRETIGPQPGPQTLLLKNRHEFEIFMGGSRWGGKSTASILDFIYHQEEYGRKAMGLALRRTFRELEDFIRLAHEFFPKFGGVWTNSTAQHATYVFPNGATIKFRHLDNDADAVHFLGHTYTRIYIEEAGSFPTPEPIFKLMATLQVPEVACGIRLNSNPGGAGTGWLRDRYISPAPQGGVLIPTKYEVPDAVTGKLMTVIKNRMFIPTYTKDNKFRYTGDTVANLYEATGGDPLLRRAWVDGDFNVQLGQFFPEFLPVKDGRPHHVINVFEPPKDWMRFFVYDPGSSEAAALTWWCSVGDNFTMNDGTLLPRGSLVMYREIYLCRRNELGNGTNTGLGKTAEDVADIICDAERHEPKGADGKPDIAYRVSDVKLFAVDSGPCMAERMARYRGLIFRNAQRQRVARNGVLAGWDYLRSRLVGCDRRPMIYWMATCIDTIRTIPLLQHDPAKPGDIITGHVEDHLADACRYAVMSRPWIQSDPFAEYRADPEEYDTRAVQTNQILVTPPPGGWLEELVTESPVPPPSSKPLSFVRSKRIW
jgi:hypothetical protein